MKYKLTILLVHGAFGDGSHWRHVIPGLVAAGYSVRAVQLSLLSLADDIQRTQDTVAAVGEPVLLVGHSYGGMVITGAGHMPEVVGLVYVAAFAPDAGEAAAGLLSLREAAPGIASVRSDAQGFLHLDYDAYPDEFCPGIPAVEALVMALSQKPISRKAFGDHSGEPAWRYKPSWYQVSLFDRIIQPETEAWFAERMRARGTIRLEAGHAALVSHGPDVTAFILAAAGEVC